MKLEDQVCSLEFAKKLKNLGVKQESYFWWELDHSIERSTFTQHCPSKIVPRSYYGGTSPKIGFISAFTVAEFGEMLPEEIESEETEYYLTIRRTLGSQWEVSYSNFRISVIYQQADTEADARAKMLIYLIENKLITI